MDAPWLADLFPRSVVRASRYRDGGVAVEHVRLVSRDSVEAIPGLVGPYRSRVRDSARLALSVGAAEVNLVLARVAGRAPWELDDPDVYDAVDTFLDDLHTATLVFPDLGGPLAVGPGTAHPEDQRIARMLRMVQRFSPRWTQRYQTALLDDPRASAGGEAEFLRGLIGVDAALCRWTGGPGGLARHGWRSAAAVVGGMLSSGGAQVGSGLVGQSVALPQGRVIAPGRRSQLKLDGARALPAERDEDSGYTMVRLLEGPDRAMVVGEPTFRQPLGTWPVSALRAVKIIHKLMVSTAEKFVFQSVDDGQAIALSVNMQRALAQFHSQGLLVGPDGKGPPEVKGGTVRDPAQPGLYAQVTAQLRPWSQNITVRVAVRPGNQPSLEVPE